MAQETKTFNKFTSIDVAQGSSVGTPALKSTAGENNNGVSSENLRVVLQDISAPSGSQFTEVTDLSAVLTVPSTAGHRIFFGSIVKPWVIFNEMTQVKSSEKFIAKYVTGGGGGTLTEVNYSTINGVFFTPNAKRVFEDLPPQYLTIDRNADITWATNLGVLDTIPTSTEATYWFCLEVPVGGITTPAQIRDIAFRSAGTSNINFNQQQMLWGNTRITVSKKIPAIEFWNGGVPEVSSIPITSTATQSVHKFRSALGDHMHAPWSLPFGIDTSSPLEFCLSYTASQAINTADIVLDLKAVSHINGTIGAGETSDRIITKNLNITTPLKVETTIFLSDYFVSDFKDDDIIFIQIGRTDSNGGDFHPIEVCINYPIFKFGNCICI